MEPFPFLGSWWTKTRSGDRYAEPEKLSPNGESRESRTKAIETGPVPLVDEGNEGRGRIERGPRNEIGGKLGSDFDAGSEVSLEGKDWKVFRSSPIVEGLNRNTRRRRICDSRGEGEVDKVIDAIKIIVAISFSGEGNC